MFRHYKRLVHRKLVNCVISWRVAEERAACDTGLRAVWRIVAQLPGAV